MQGEEDVLFLESCTGEWEDIDDTEGLRVGDAIKLNTRVASHNAIGQLSVGLMGIARKTMPKEFEQTRRS